MGNMAYCRFQNTLADLNECTDFIEDTASPEEEKAKLKLIRLCKSIAEEFGFMLEDEDEDGE